MSRIVKRTRVAARNARRRLVRLLDRALPERPRNRNGHWSDPDWFRFPPF